MRFASPLLSRSDRRYIAINITTTTTRAPIIHHSILAPGVCLFVVVYAHRNPICRQHLIGPVSGVAGSARWRPFWALRLLPSP